MRRFALSTLLLLTISACSNIDSESTPPVPSYGAAALNEAASLASIVDARTDEEKVRDKYRHPLQTLEFIGIKPGMSIIEVLPGQGWYSKIISPYLGATGTHHAVNYADEMWPMFGFFTDDFIAQRQKQMIDWPGFVDKIGGNGSSVSGSAFGRIPEEFHGTVDAALFVRAVHNLNRFEESAGMRSQALTETYKLLKSGGIVGVVQHRAPEDAPDQWANGDAGYLKQSAVIAMFEDVGFKLEDSSEINANANDRPTTDDIVWRLPPSYRGANDDAEKKAALDAIGESDRMTLRFVKP